MPCGDFGQLKGTLLWFRRLQAFCKELEDELIERRDILFEGKVIYSSEQIDRYVSENPDISIQSKINGLNERVQSRLKNEIFGKEISYPAPERRRLLKEYFEKNIHISDVSFTLSEPGHPFMLFLSRHSDVRCFLHATIILLLYKSELPLRNCGILPARKSSQNSFEPANSKSASLSNLSRNPHIFPASPAFL